jgi:hypothetical protein
MTASMLDSSAARSLITQDGENNVLLTYTAKSYNTASKTVDERESKTITTRTYMDFIRTIENITELKVDYSDFKHCLQISDLPNTRN